MAERRMHPGRVGLLAYQLFRVNFSALANSTVEPTKLSATLFSKGLITMATHQEVSSPHGLVSPFVRNNKLLMEVDKQIKSGGDKSFLQFCQALMEIDSMRNTGEKLMRTLCSVHVLSHYQDCLASELKRAKIDPVNLGRAFGIDVLQPTINQGNTNSSSEAVSRLVNELLKLFSEQKTSFEKFQEVLCQYSQLKNLTTRMSTKFKRLRRNPDHIHEWPDSGDEEPDFCEPQSPLSSLSNEKSQDDNLISNSGPGVLSYSKYLKKLYLEDRHRKEVKWPQSILLKEYINLLLINKDEVQDDQERVFTESVLRGEVDTASFESMIIGFDQLAKLGPKGEKAKCIIVSGDPGSGKTVFSWEVCKRWAKGEILGQYDLVVMLPLRDPCVRKANCIKDLFPVCDDLLMSELHKTYGDGVLLLMDGFDELTEKDRFETSFFLEVVKGNVLQLGTVMITGRPWAISSLLSRHPSQVSQFIKIFGFTRENTSEYIQQAFGNFQQKLPSFEEYLDLHPSIRSLMYLPLNCAIISEVFKQSSSMDDAPKTLTQLHQKFIGIILSRYLNNHPDYNYKEWVINDINDLPIEVIEEFNDIAKLAYEGIVRNQLVFTDLPKDFQTLDLLQNVPQAHTFQPTVFTYNFIHLTLQEYLAAYYVLKVNKRLVSSIMLSKGDDYEQVKMFLAGLDFNTISCHISKYHTLAQLRYLYESQDVSMVKKLTVSEIKLHSQGVSLHDAYVLGYCIALGNQQWSVSITDCKVTDSHLFMLSKGFITQKNRFSQSCGKITQLKLNGTAVSSTGLLSALPVLKSLVKLNVCCQTLDEDFDSFFFSCNRFLRELHISLPSSIEQSKKLASMCGKIEKLVIKSPSRSELPVSFVSSLLNNATFLEHLKLKRMSITEECPLSDLRNCKSLDSLVMQNCSIHFRVVRMISDFLKSESVQLSCLDLSGCLIKSSELIETTVAVASDVVLLADALKINTHLKYLNLAWNDDIEDALVFLLLNSALNNEKSALEKLFLPLHQVERLKNVSHLDDRKKLLLAPHLPINRMDLLAGNLRNIGDELFCNGSSQKSLLSSVFHYLRAMTGRR